MQALLAVLAGLVGLLLVPLALGAGTAWLLIPGHLLFSVACAMGAMLAGWSGRSGRALAFGGGHLIGTLAVVAAFTVGAEVREGSIYWMVPWVVGLAWGWIPAVLAGIFAEIGRSRRRQKTRRVVRQRRREQRLVR